MLMFDLSRLRAQSRMALWVNFVGRSKLVARRNDAEIRAPAFGILRGLYARGVSFHWLGQSVAPRDSSSCITIFPLSKRRAFTATGPALFVRSSSSTREAATEYCCSRCMFMWVIREKAPQIPRPTKQRFDAPTRSSNSDFY
jgi:hypothetical protein